MNSDRVNNQMLEHKYGENVHIVSDIFLTTLLARLCSKDTHQPFLNHHVEEIYRSLLQIVINREFPRKKIKFETRMIDFHPEAVLNDPLVDENQKVVSVNLARAGTLPSHVCYSALNYILNPSNVRQDHVSIARATDSKEQVIGANVAGHKIGGGVKDAIVIFPDPMGATGGTIVSTIDIYKKDVEGPARKFIAMHLIVTPEYIRKVTKAHPDAMIYAVRLDRGLSDPKILNTVPGTNWDEEKGLNGKQYIVPGGGGIGEILNNAFV